MEQVSSSPAATVANIEELLAEILLRVPAETLTRFKRVSKHWLSLITSPSFRSSHAKCVHNKTLYICTVETLKGHGFGHVFDQYRVQAIKYSDLFSFSDTPITISRSKSKSKCKTSVLREVALLDSRSVPRDMLFGVFRSRIVLAGEDSDIRYHGHKPCYFLDHKALEARFVSSVIPDINEDEYAPSYLLQEIDGKLYYLSATTCAEFDPKTKVWAPLPPLPNRIHYIRSCSTLGSKIIATLWISGETITFCVDVASPCRSWTTVEQPLLEFYRAEYTSPKVSVVDLENDEFEKLMFSYSDGKILVNRMFLSNEGEPNKIELVASIDLPDLPSFSSGCVASYCCDRLGDKKVCFSFLYRQPFCVNLINLLVLTLEYAHSKSPDISNSSTSDPSGSFSAKTLGYQLFECDDREVTWARFGGCFVL